MHWRAGTATATPVPSDRAAHHGCVAAEVCRRGVDGENKKGEELLQQLQCLLATHITPPTGPSHSLRGTFQAYPMLSCHATCDAHLYRISAMRPARRILVTTIPRVTQVEFILHPCHVTCTSHLINRHSTYHARRSHVASVPSDLYVTSQSPPFHVSHTWNLYCTRAT